MRGLHLLHPEAEQAAEALITACHRAGLNIQITDTLRTVAEQDKLYAQGRTVPGSIVTNCRGVDFQSPHQWGVAFDFCRGEKGREYNNADGFFEKVGAIGKQFGILYWGGDWKTPDRPHFELKKYMPNNSTQTLKKSYITPEGFMRAWPKTAPPLPIVLPSYEKTVANLVSDGVIEDPDHWTGYLSGMSSTRPEYVRAVFDRYSALLRQ